MNNKESSYCELIPLNTKFNNKPLYKCNFCGLTVGLENPDTKILCFKKLESLHTTINKIDGWQDVQEPKHYTSKDNIEQDILASILNKKVEENTVQEKETSPENLCSEEQIEARLNICKTCEYYKDNSCLLCGCVVVRDSNYKNKLAHKDQKCPADKWGPITD